MINLHTHTMYSILDAISKPEDIVAKVKEMKQPAIAITEHGNVFSAVKMYKLCKENGIKFIYGCEFYITEDRFVKDKDNKYYHLTVLAKNEQGRININKLVTIGYLEGFYYKPRIDFRALVEHKDGLIVLSGCMASELQRNLAAGNYEKAREVVRRYRDVFGEDYYLEIQSHREPVQQQLNRMIVDLAKEFGIKWVVTADSHFINEEDQELHSIFVEIGQSREVGETYKDTQLQSEDEAREYLETLTKEEIDAAIKTTHEIAEKCDVHIPLSAPLIPHVKVPEQFKDENEYLKHLINEGWIRRGFNKLPKEEREKYKQRLYYEYDAITRLGFAGYYLLVHSYANTVKRRGIARGSGGGSLIAYLLNIVDIDPVKYGLYFERFIDVGQLHLLEQGLIKPEELKIPDVDLDFGCEDREKVVQFIVDTYGKDRVASIGTFQYMWAKSAIKDVGRVLGIPFEETNKITKELEGIKEFGDEDDAESEHSRFVELINTNPILKTYAQKYPKLFDYAKRLTGIPRAFSMHPCGKVVTINDLTYYTAIALDKSGGEQVLQMDMKDAEALGLVKIDTLGLRTVDVIYDTLEMIGKDYEYINPQKLNFSDEKVLEIFRGGHTVGVFQFESEGMKATLKKMKPSGIDDLGAANALYRPGAMAYIDNYVRRKFGQEEITYLHPDLEPILKPTYGIIVYQEQLIEIGRLAGLRNPDLLRKATGKKDAKLMAQVEPELREGLYRRGWTKEQVDKLWDDMVEFAKYSFNKSHSYAYAIIAYICAFLKAYHPVEFMTALINSYEGKHDEMEKCYYEAKRLGIEFVEPNWRHTSPLCRVEDGKIVYGTSLLKYCNRQVSLDLQKLANNKYDTFVDLLADIKEQTNIDSRQMNILITLGYFSEFGKPKKLLRVYEEFEKKYKTTHKQQTKEKRLAELREFERSTPDEDLNIKERIKAEKEYYGFIKTTLPKVDKSYVFVIETETKYTPKIKFYQLKTGREFEAKIKRTVFFDENGIERIFPGDIIKVLKHAYRPKMKKVDDKWVETDESELYIEQFSVVKTE